MNLGNRIRHALRKPLRVILWKVGQRTLRQARRFGYWEQLAARTKRHVHHKTAEELRMALAQAPQVLAPGELSRATDVLHSRPAEREQIIAAADAYTQLRFSYLGWRREFKVLPLPWTTDWASGREWPARYYADYDYSEPETPSDVKSCWEPSRFHFAVTLGQAYRLTGNASYRQHFFELLRDWTVQNPYAHSINWTSPLEVAVRGLNLAAAASLFSDAPSSDLRFLVERLALHGAFVYRNVEYTDVRGNHYTGNLVGLLAIGLLLQEVVPEARAWVDYAEERIAPEVLIQILPDGVNREKSLPYHRFVTELFLLAAILLDRAGRPVGAPARERLQRAVEFSRIYTRPDGRAPVIGDNDNARALPLTVADTSDHSHLAAVSALLWPQASLPVPGKGAGEAVWIFGEHPPDRGGAPQSGAYPFPDGGFYVLRNGRDYVIVDAGDVGLQSGGCHGHHDMLSFEWVSGGIPVVVDSGSPCYTGNVALKNDFRITRAHNTAVVDRTEQGAFDPRLIWHLGPEARPEHAGVENSLEGLRFTGAHVGYRRLTDPVTHTRSLVLATDGSLAMVDHFTGAASHEVEIFLHLAPAVRATMQEGGIKLEAEDRSWMLTWDSPEVECELRTAGTSPAYGEVVPTTVIRLSRTGELPWALSYRFQTQ